MLYEMLRHKPRNTAPPLPLHYFDSAELLHRLHSEGHSRADMARITGLTVPQINDRLQLLTLEEGLRTYLRQSGAPECIALVLLQLPDAVTRLRMARRIIGERLCVRDAALLVHSALRKRPRETCRQQVIMAIRDVRPYRNAIRDIAEQMKTAGVRASFTERRTGGMQELTISYPARRRRTERYHSM